MAADRSSSPHEEDPAPDPAALASAHRDRLLSVYEKGRQAYGGLPLDFDAFTPRALECVRRRMARAGLALTPDRVGEALSSSHVADLFLAIACDEGVAGAWEVFADRFGPRLRELALRGGAARGEAGDIARELPGELCTPPPTGNTRTHLGTYDGTGSLLGWLKVIVLRRVVDRRRAHAPASLDDHPEDDPARSAELPDASSSGANPSSLAADREARGRYKSALVVAWHALTPQESVALLAKYRDGLAQREITHLLGVGDSRVSRILDRATTKIREALRQCMEPAELTRFWSAMTSAVQNHLANPGEPADYPGEGNSTRRGVGA
jgi:RNA polymerase sigma factor (sigma-70 family)